MQSWIRPRGNLITVGTDTLQMMKTILSVAVAFGMACMSLAAPRQVLMPGDPAPELRVSQWIKGDPIARFEKGQVYVVELWATWCGPCRRSVPHLTELAKKHGKDVVIIGISVREVGDDIVGGVRRFVAEMGDRMQYHVAMDSADKGTERLWQDAALRRGIPVAFIVGKDGRLAWIGHPMVMADPLQRVIEGNFDVSVWRAEFQKDVDRVMREEAGLALIAAAQEKGKKGLVAEALDELDSVFREIPELARDVFRTKAVILATDEAGIRDLIGQAPGMLGANASEALANASLFIVRDMKRADLDPKIERSARLMAAAALKTMTKEMEIPVLYYVSMLYLQLEDFPSAATHLERLLKAIPVNEETRSLIAEVQRLLDRARKG